MKFDNLLEVQQTFDSEKKCREHLAAVRWPNGIVCPKCGSFGHINPVNTRKLWWCGDCKRQFSIRIGTMFEGSRVSLAKWFSAIWLITSYRKRISSHQLARDIGVTQKTALSLHRSIREAMTDLDSGGSPLAVMEKGDPYGAGKEENGHNQQTSGSKERYGETTSATIALKKRGNLRTLMMEKGNTVRLTVSKNVMIPDSHVSTESVSGPPSFEQVLGYAANPESSHETFINLVQGDCLEKLKAIQPSSVHLVIADPPYFLDGLDEKWRKGKADSIKGTGAVGGLPVGMKFDPKQGRRLQAFMERCADLFLTAMKPGAFAAVFSQPRLAHRMAAGLEDAGFEIRDLLAWHFTRRAQFKAFSMDHFVEKMEIPDDRKRTMKRKLARRKTPQLRPQFEAVILAQKPREGTFVNNWLTYETGLMDASATLNGTAPSTVMMVEKPLNRNGHLTPKPVLLCEHLINLFSTRGQVVLDPFLGSGTTAVAAVHTGRSCIGIEIEADYIRVAEDRLKEME